MVAEPDLKDGTHGIKAESQVEVDPTGFEWPSHRRDGCGFPIRAGKT